MSLLKIKNLSIAFGIKNNLKRVVAGLNLSIQTGQCMGLVGESGSGKSITALAIMQLLPTTASVSKDSKILLHQHDLLNYSEKRMRHVRGSRVSMIFQDAMSAFNPVLTIGQQMSEVLLGHLKLSVREINKRAFDLLQEVGISDPTRVFRSYPHQLSGGMRQRAMIAMALCGEPELMIADEPTTALDVTIQAQVLKLLNSLKEKRNLSLLFISHDLAVVSQIADNITVLRHGKCVEQAKSEKFFQHPVHEYSKRLLAAIPSAKPKHSLIEKEEPLLKIENLKVYFPIRRGIFKRKVGDVKAVDNISFSLAPRQTLALVGESGSGKTTVAKAIVRLIQTTAGVIHFCQYDLTRVSNRVLKSLRSDFQIIFQDPYTALNPRMMVADCIIEGMAAQRIIVSRKKQLERVDELLEQVGLLPEHKWRYPHEFSGGERQRICIARALALKPKLLILDEPTSALDVSIQMQVLKLLEYLQAQYGLSYLLITHNLSIVAHMSEFLVIMRHGKIVEQGPTEVILQDPKDPYTKKLLASVPEIKKVNNLGSSK